MISWLLKYKIIKVKLTHIHNIPDIFLSKKLQILNRPTNNFIILIKNPESDVSLTVQDWVSSVPFSKNIIIFILNKNYYIAIPLSLPISLLNSSNSFQLVYFNSIVNRQTFTINLICTDFLLSDNVKRYLIWR